MSGAAGNPGGFQEGFDSGEGLFAGKLNRVLVEAVIRVLVGGQGINIRSHGQQIVIESEGVALGGTGSNGIWV